MKSKRNSNIELLRIFVMLMIVSYHIFYHSIKIQLTDPYSIERMSNGLFCHPSFSNKMFILATFAPLGKVGNAIFIMISGYFMVSKGNNIDLARIAKKLLTQQIFAALILTISSTIIWKALNGVYIDLVEFNIFNGMSWFIGYYFLLIVIARLFLNNYLGKLDRNGYIAFLLVMFGLTQFSWINDTLNNLAPGVELLLLGIFLYSLGGGLKRFDLFGNIKLWFWVVCLILSMALIYLSTYNAINMRIQDYIRNNSNDLFTQIIPTFYDNNLLCIVMALGLFIMFSKLNIGSIKIINFIGSSTLMIYLIHDNPLAYSLWNLQDWITVLHQNPLEFLVKLLCVTVVTFMVGFVLYCIYYCLTKMRDK